MSSKKINTIQDKLLEWYAKEGRMFPWREPNLSFYQYIIAEVLLQRTRAETVSRFYKLFVNKFPSWEALAKADSILLEEALMPVGLYRQRAKRLNSLANEMTKKQGKFPDAREEIESIPFMGQYISNAVELFVFGKPKPLLDVNMARVLERVFKARTLADIRYDPYLQKLAHKIVNHPKAKELNWGILDLAAKICQARMPKCTICPLNSNCNFYKKHKF